MKDEVVRTIASHFQVQGEFVSAEPYGSGHINQTFLGRYRTNDGERRYIHQRINERVFTDVPKVMENIGRVIRHIRAKHALTLVPTIVPTKNGSDVLHAEDGSWWRTYIFITGARTYDRIANPTQAYQAARAFGRFAELLVDMPGEPLHETIPGFHDTNKRYATLLGAAGDDSAGRVREVEREIEYCRSNAPLADALAALKRSGLSRDCVTHNDTKLNNVMLDEATGEGVCVIDLDTVMPGMALYDFGDMVRTATMPVAEDERDLSLVETDETMFEAIARGFVEGAGSLLAREEREHLLTAGITITFEQGIRFLTDYLKGDTYFRTHYPGQNLDRARTQFALVESLGRKRDRLLQTIVHLSG
jgi:aminoglycoside phosphotransferase (APT) family kinase protein